MVVCVCMCVCLCVLAGLHACLPFSRQYEWCCCPVWFDFVICVQHLCLSLFLLSFQRDVLRLTCCLCVCVCVCFVCMFVSVSLCLFVSLCLCLSLLCFVVCVCSVILSLPSEIFLLFIHTKNIHTLFLSPLFVSLSLSLSLSLPFPFSFSSLLPCHNHVKFS